ncbi:hypothetical protein F5Y14DRAFT_463745 [Nemania sp. NC0429]|nr:hypothetical protein F5Y14DRAFT_463745 [Nemania sp. NC0429]
MSPSLNPFGHRAMTKKALYKLVERLDETYNCVDHFEALTEKRGYDNSKQFPANLYKRGIQKELLDHWSESPSVHTLTSNSDQFDAGIAGCEWAAFLRVRNPEAVVLRVRPTSRTASAGDILRQLISSLIYNLATLVPEEFEKADLSKDNFELLAQGGAGGVGAGLKILAALPPLEVRRGGILIIVDGLNLAEDARTADEVRRFKSVLESLSAQNYGHLLYTMGQRR